MRAHALSIAVTSVAALLLAGCGGGQDGPPAPVAGPPPVQFTPAAMDFDRPCTLLTPTDAAAIFTQPFFRTLASDAVNENTVRCAQTVGQGGLQGVVELSVEYPLAGQTAELVFLSLCRETMDAPPSTPGAPVQLQANAPAAAQRPVSAAPAEVTGRACVLDNGGYALLLPDRVLMLLVRDGAGAPLPGQSLELAKLVSRRVAAQRR